MFATEWGARAKHVGLEALSFSPRLFTGLDDKGVPAVCVKARQGGAERGAQQDQKERCARRRHPQLGGISLDISPIAFQNIGSLIG